MNYVCALLLYNCTLNNFLLHIIVSQTILYIIVPRTILIIKSQNGKPILAYYNTSDFYNTATHSNLSISCMLSSIYPALILSFDTN